MIQLSRIGRQFGEKILYQDVSLTLHHGQCYGLAGINGAGKTVLLRMISGEDLPDSGTITIGNTVKIGYLPQEIETKGDQTPMETVLEPFRHLLNAESAFAELSANTDPESPEFLAALKSLETMQEEIHHHDIYSLNSRASAIMSGLGIAQEYWGKDMSLLSGGYRMRVFLARLLLLTPDFLLLDEPTNHLDMDSLIWLERFLERFPGGILVISHDRSFLDKLTTRTLEIKNRTIVDYHGNYSAYKLWRGQQDKTTAQQIKNLSEKIEKTERFVERFKSKATKATQAQSRMKQLDKLREALPEEAQSNKTMHFKLPPASACGAVPFTLQSLATGYNGTAVSTDINLTISRGEKIAIIGPNGAGKSTLLKSIAQVLPPISGTIRMGHNVDVRYFSQHRLEELDDEKTLYDTVAFALGENRPSEVRRLLGSFLFSGDEVLKPISVCSGGEKSRLSLLLMLVHPGNVLLLDEPTNHLDVDTVETLANALAEYDGTIIMVSHDAFFINQIANRIIEVRPGLVRDFPGTLDEYREYVEKNCQNTSNSLSNKKNPSISDTETDTKAQRIRQREERKRLQRLIDKREQEIEHIATQITQKKAMLNDESIAMDHEKLALIFAELSTLNRQNDDTMIAWELLHEELDAHEE